ncbi:MAG: deoxyribonuclease IV [Spirochaetales bacterium]|uniref:Probable endonuclease 4 n=1 Tax=Candidatus Thalassospirochaeta sargassi TaxID=3119039 RepID=A0AAJ1IH75_9SPIO|nr:deoxyribonuclease IV [Spirochaetales bacterium]
MNDKYVGAHVTTAGGVENSLLHADHIKAAGFALFTRNQRRWESHALTVESIRLFRERMIEYGYTAEQVLPHNSYLINLAQPDPQKRARSYDVFIDELRRVELLGLKFLNFHPGSTVGIISKDEGIELIADAINRAHLELGETVHVLETTSGQKNKIGGTFEELAEIIERVEDKSRIGVCIDTCHIFAAGYDISTLDGWQRTIQEFDRIIGLEYLKGLHLNDSAGTLDSRIDRHANIGEGEIGLEGFRALMNDSRLDKKPMILETPAKREWDKELELLRGLIRE